MPKAVLRQFLYLDENLVTDFLGQLPGGLKSDTGGQTEKGGGKSVGGGAQAGPFGVKAGLDRTSKETTQFTVLPTAAASFQRLYASLLEQQLLQELPVADEAIWGQLQVREFVEVIGLLSQPRIIKQLSVAEQIVPLLPVLEQFGMNVDQKGLEQISHVDKLLSLFQSDQICIIAAVAGAPKYRFVCFLRDKWLRAEPRELDGELTVLGKIQRKVGRKESVTTVDFMKGLESFVPKPPRAARRAQGGKAVPQGVPPDFAIENEIQIPYPSAVLTAIAVYR